MHAILVHGWRGWPDNAWFPWLRKQLEREGWSTEAPAMPEPMTPDRDAWVATLERTIEAAITRGASLSNIVLVGHSLGCLTILFALERHQGARFAHVVLASGFARNFGAPGIGTWLDRPIHLEAVRAKARTWSVLHGAGDVVVPVAEGQWLASRLGIPLTPTSWPGHFMHEEGVRELPEARAALLS